MFAPNEEEEEEEEEEVTACTARWTQSPLTSSFCWADKAEEWTWWGGAADAAVAVVAVVAAAEDEGLGCVWVLCEAEAAVVAGDRCCAWAAGKAPAMCLCPLMSQAE